MSFAWPSIIRVISPVLHKDLKDKPWGFVGSNGEPYQKPYSNINNKLAKSFDKDSSLETYKSLLERLGLVIVQDKVLHASKSGKELYNAVQELNGKVVKIMIRQLSKFQFKNPLIRGFEIPEDCDVLPFFAIWKILRNCENKLHQEELLRLVVGIRYMSEVDDVIQKINEVRRNTPDYEALIKGGAEARLDTLLGVRKLDTAQPSTDSSYWFSAAGMGGAIIYKDEADQFRYLTPEAIPFIDELISNPPLYIDFGNDHKSWIEYYYELGEEQTEIPLREESSVLIIAEKARFIDVGEGEYIITLDDSSIIYQVQVGAEGKVLVPYKKLRRPISDLVQTASG